VRYLFNFLWALRSIDLPTKEDILNKLRNNDKKHLYNYKFRVAGISNSNKENSKG
jgi:hypothetical protein